MGRYEQDFVYIVKFRGRARAQMPLAACRTPTDTKHKKRTNQQHRPQHQLHKDNFLRTVLLRYLKMHTALYEYNYYFIRILTSSSACCLTFIAPYIYNWY